MKIKSISRKPFKGIVYNFGVLGDESYVVEGVKVGNCRGFWMPVLGFDTIEGKVGLPKSITRAFTLFDGFPLTNEFKQIKKSK